jgi:hypothetical protein
MADKTENLLAKPQILEGGEEVSIVGISQETKSKNQKKKMKKSQEEILTAQKEFDRAEAKLRMAKIDAEYEPDEETPVMEEKIKGLKEKVADNEPPLKEENYLTIEQLAERKELIKQKDQEIEEAKMRRDDMLQEEDMKKLSQILGKEPSTSPTIAEREASNDIASPPQRLVASQEEILKSIGKRGDRMIILKDETKLTEERECPLCKGKLIKKNKVMNTGNGIFTVERTICSNSRKGFKFWKKIICTYSKNIAERID